MYAEGTPVYLKEMGLLSLVHSRICSFCRVVQSTHLPTMVGTEGTAVNRRALGSVLQEFLRPTVPGVMRTWNREVEGAREAEKFG